MIEFNLLLKNTTFMQICFLGCEKTGVEFHLTFGTLLTESTSLIFMLSYVCFMLQEKGLPQLLKENRPRMRNFLLGFGEPANSFRYDQEQTNQKKG